MQLPSPIPARKEEPMDVKRYDFISHPRAVESSSGEYVPYEDIEKHYITRPDPAEVEHAP